MPKPRLSGTAHDRARTSGVSLPFWTVGHSTRSIEQFAALLAAADIGQVVDIRTIRRSRTNPQYNEDVLPANLGHFGIGCEHIPELGGLRGRSRDVPPDLNGFWMNESFHNYADYALSDSFRTGLDRLVSLGRLGRCTMMCSEAVWWRCHRRIVTDYLLSRGETVYHLMGENRIAPARLTDGARILSSGSVLYPADARQQQ